MRQKPKPKPKPNPKPNPKPKPGVLVVGDSFVDENWLMSPFHVYHAYNVGHDHYISDVPDTEVRILSLCGAASAWRILNGAPSGTLQGAPESLRSKYDLLGLSAWNPLDHKRLLCLLCPVGNEKKHANPFLLSGLEAPGESGRCPYAEQDCTDPPRFINLIDGKEEGAIKCASTNRLIRVYAGFGGDQPRLESRYDWRLGIKASHKKKGAKEDYQPILDEIKSENTNIDAIVVVDHGYGVLDEQLIKSLRVAFPRAKWYVRCKVDDIEWLKELSEADCNIRLAFTDEQLMKYRYGARKWMQGQNVVGRGALEVLGDLLGLDIYRNTNRIRPADRAALHSANAAVLLDDDTAITASRTGAGRDDDAHIACTGRSAGPLQPIRVTRSTVFFASLVYWDLMRKPLDENSIGPATDWASRNQQDWTASCTRAWLEASPTELSGPFDQAIYSLPVEARKDTSPLPLYSSSWKEWNDSSKDMGIVGGQIHLWRAQGTVGKYICPGGEKRNQINNLVRRLGVYHALRDRAHPFNCLFIAEPGWGKSYLAQRLADRFDYEYVGVTIAGMASNKDLMDALKGISSLQNEIRKQVLVFVDEIDALIEGHSAMGLLLGPMWDGTFKTEGVAYRIQPCVWVFASTKPISLLLCESKGRDFLARINGLVVELDAFSDDGDREKIHRDQLHRNFQDESTRLAEMERIVREKGGALRTEMVYHGVNFLNHFFGPISLIDKGVLQIFYDSFPINGVRSLEIFVSRFRNVSGGKVSVANVPSFDDYPELRRHIRPLAKWPTQDTRIDVKVVVNAPGQSNLDI